MTIFIHRYNGKIENKEEFSYAVRQLDNLMGQIDAQGKLTDKLYELLRKEEAKLQLMVEEAGAMNLEILTTTNQNRMKKVNH
jgi:hypothetical protein